MNYFVNKIQSEIQDTYTNLLETFYESSIDYIQRTLRSHFLVEINFDTDDISDDEIYKVLELIDNRMGTKKLNSNSYIDYKGKRKLRGSAQYFVYFKKYHSFMIVKGTPYEGSDYAENVHIYFGGKGAYRL